MRVWRVRVNDTPGTVRREAGAGTIRGAATSCAPACDGPAAAGPPGTQAKAVATTAAATAKRPPAGARPGRLLGLESVSGGPATRTSAGDGRPAAGRVRPA